MRKFNAFLRKPQLIISSIPMVLVVIILCFSIPVIANTGVPAEIKFTLQVESMKPAGVGPVIYPHKLHENIYECSDCHPNIFIEKAGGNKVNMQKNIDGKYCGSSGCHNSEKAFPLYFCEKCHSEVTGIPK